MALVLHRRLADGSVVHEPFSRESWERALHDPNTADRWGHPPDDCRDPIEVVRGRKTTTVAKVEAPPASAPPSPKEIEAVAWPPEAEMRAEELSQLSGLCAGDCRELLRGPAKVSPPSKLAPMTDARGQMLLF